MKPLTIGETAQLEIPLRPETLLQARASQHILGGLSLHRVIICTSMQWLDQHLEHRTRDFKQLVAPVPVEELVFFPTIPLKTPYWVNHRLHLAERRHGNAQAEIIRTALEDILPKTTPGYTPDQLQIVCDSSDDPDMLELLSELDELNLKSN